MRITTSMQFKSLLSALQQMGARSATLARQVTSGRRVERPSDDPVAAARLSVLATDIARLDQLDRSARAGEHVAKLADSTLDVLGGLLLDVKQLAILGASDGSTVTRPAIADEVDGLAAQILTTASVRAEGRYLLSGTLTDQVPFDTAGVYQGNGDALTAMVDEGQRVVVAPTAAEVLQGVVDVPRVLQELATALRSDDKVRIRSAIAELDVAFDQVTRMRTRIGSTLVRIESGLLRRGEHRVILQEEISGLGDASLPELFTELAQIDQAREASLAAAARIGQRNLFDFLA